MARSPVTLRKLGGTYQLLLDRPADLEHLWDLDEARWVANSAPIEALNVDPAFLRFLDLDHNRRIRPEELRNAVRWTLDLLADRSEMGAPAAVLKLGHVNTAHPQGPNILAAARRILANLGTPDADRITLAEVRDLQRIRGSAKTNGDGIIPPEAVEDPDLQAFIGAIIETVGFEADLGGKPGVTGKLVDAFLKASEERLAWLAEAEADPAILWLGDDTEGAYAALTAVADDLDEYFRLCDLARLDPQLLVRLEEREAKRASEDTAAEAVEAFLRRAPLAPPNPEGSLDLDGWLHPDARARMARFCEQVLERVPEDTEPLTPVGWAAVQAHFAPYARWRASEKGTVVAKLGRDVLQRYLDEGRFRSGLSMLIAADREVAEELARVAVVERLILYQRWLLEFANNFVNFQHFYDPERRSLVEWGTLVMDGRRFDLAVRVHDVPAHKARAKDGMICLLYADVVGRAADERMQVAVAVTSADRGSLYVGKRGIFFTTDGRDWDAEVIDILENPISLWEAIKKPFVGLVTMITQGVEKFTDARYSKLESAVSEGLDATEARAAAAHEVVAAAPVEPEPEAAPTAASTAASAQSLMLSGGVAVAALSSAFAYMAQTLTSIDIGELLLMMGVLAALLLIPTIALAAWRLHRRDLALVLEAGGWAINSRLRIPRWAGAVFTRTPPLPVGALERSTDLLLHYRQRAAHEVKRTVAWAWSVSGIALLVALVVLGWWLWQSGVVVL